MKDQTFDMKDTLEHYIERNKEHAEATDGRVLAYFCYLKLEDNGGYIPE